jgi:hypothetical protein
MAANNLSHRRNKGAQKSRSTAREPKQQEGNSIGQMREQVSEYYERGSARVRDMTQDHEGTAVLIALTAGFSVGLVIGCALAASPPKSRRWTDRIAAEGLGRRLLERVEGMIPDMISERLSR